jgi:hypothetical protein
MFQTNQFADSDPAMQQAMSGFMAAYWQQQRRQQAIRNGTLKPEPASTWDISDRH